MAKGGKENAIGIDLGEYSVKVAQSLSFAAGVYDFKVAAFNIPLELSGREKDSFIVERLPKFLNENKFRKGPVHASFPAEESCVRVVTIPAMADAELTEAVRWAVKRHVAYPLEEMALGFSKQGEILEGGVKKLKIVFIAAQKAALQKHIQLLRKASLKPAYVSAGCFALCNLLDACGFSTDKSLVFVNIGYSDTSITFFKDGQLVFTRSIMCGGRAINEDIKKALTAEAGAITGIDRVERMKNELGVIISDTRGVFEGVPVGRYATAVNACVDNLVKEVQLSFSHYNQISHGSEISKVLLCGGGGGLKNIANILSEKLNTIIEVLAAPTSISLSVMPGDNNYDAGFYGFATAIGLTLDSGATPNLVFAQKGFLKIFLAGQKAIKRTIAFSGGALALIFAVLFLINMFYGNAFKQSAKELNSLENENADISGVKRSLANLEAQKKLYLRLAGLKPQVAKILLLLSKSVDPDKVVMQALNLESLTEGEPKLTLQGDVKGSGRENASDIFNALVSQLEASKYFKKVIPSVREGGSFASGEKILSFTIDCQLEKHGENR